MWKRFVNLASCAWTLLVFIIWNSSAREFDVWPAVLYPVVILQALGPLVRYLVTGRFRPEANRESD